LSEVAKWVEDGPDPKTDGVVRWRCADLRDRIAAKFNIHLHERSVGKLLKKLDFSSISVRPMHPQTDLEAQEAFTSEKTGLHRMEAGDSQALLALIADLRKKVATKLGVEAAVVSCFEAGRDGFWLHRLLLEHGVINHVVEPTSILVNRRARRAKTDRLDAQGLLRILAAHAKGDHDVCSVVRVPTIEEEDAKRQHREREHLVQERVRIENRIAALSTTQGVRKRPKAGTMIFSISRRYSLAVRGLVFVSTCSARNRRKPGMHHSMQSGSMARAASTFPMSAISQPN
jgi:Winged helix-turn helix